MKVTWKVNSHATVRQYGSDAPCDVAGILSVLHANKQRGFTGIPNVIFVPEGVDVSAHYQIGIHLRIGVKSRVVARGWPQPQEPAEVACFPQLQRPLEVAAQHEPCPPHPHSPYRPS